MTIHAKKKATPKPVVGLVVKFGQHTYTLLSPLEPRKGWRVANTQGQEFRMPPTHLKQALQETFA